MEKGFIQVYTGNGKGKTTAAFGLALRAVGQGMKVLVIQFMKGTVHYGETEAARKLSPNLMVKKIGREAFVSRTNPDPIDLKLAGEGMGMARRAIETRDVDLLILDEVNVAVDYGLIALPEILQILEATPETMELVLTGRNARPEILERADLVTEMVEKKHYYTKGVKARKGIEF